MNFAGFLLFYFILGLLSCVLCQVDYDDGDGPVNLDPMIYNNIQNGIIETGEFSLEPPIPDPQNVPALMMQMDFENCVCVSFEFCKNNTLNTNGEGIIRVR